MQRKEAEDALARADRAEAAAAEGYAREQRLQDEVEELTRRLAGLTPDLELRGQLTEVRAQNAALERTLVKL